MKSIVGFITENKGIVKKALIVGGTALGLAIVARVVKSRGDESDDSEYSVDENDSVGSDEN
jgi:hypothetical protein